MRARAPLLSAFAAAFLASAAFSAASAATVTAAVSASNVKPLVISKLSDLDFGTVTLGPGIWSNATLSLTQTGVLNCTNANLTCTGTTSVAVYNVQGSKQQPVRISAPAVTLVNQSDSTKTLTLTMDAPTSIVLANSGSRGSNFSVGGSVVLSSTTAAGTYVGTMNVTVDY